MILSKNKRFFDLFNAASVSYKKSKFLSNCKYRILNIVCFIVTFASTFNVHHEKMVVELRKTETLK